MPDGFLAYVVGPGRLFSLAAMQAVILIHAYREHFGVLIRSPLWVSLTGAEAEAVVSRCRNWVRIERGIISGPCPLDSLRSKRLNDLQRVGAGV